MATFTKSAICILSLMGHFSTALPERRDAQGKDGHIKPTPCYSYTVTTPYTRSGPFYCPNIPNPCPPYPMCLHLTTETLTVPCSNTKCPTTPTVTVTGPPVCPTCQTGCAAYTETATITTGCVKVTPYVKA